MSSKGPVITVENVSKIYRVGVQDAANENMIGAFLDFIRSPLKNYRKYRSLYDFSDVIGDDGDGEDSNVLWALRDVSFEVEQGDVVGIIGMNGAGKSTLLKLLSRITPPTRGEINIRGRVGSLLEVGTGFHPELTGRENVYLNGTILGMRKNEVDRKFDEIVDFAAVDKFLDTPVKRYSSGMRVRLAFAVAAHLEPEILIVDEVLAVGDYEFQRKCINKMQDVSGEGRTVLFVSHNMPSVARLCSRAILLNKGEVIKDGKVEEIISAYLSSGSGVTSERTWSEDEAPGRNIARLRAIRVKDKDGKVNDTIEITEPVHVEMEYEVLESGHKLVPNIHFHNDQGINLFMTIDNDDEWRGKPRPAGYYKSTVTIPGNLFAEGMVFITPALIPIRERKGEFVVQQAVAFQVVDRMVEDSARAGYTKTMYGVMRPLVPWQTVLSS